MTTAIMKAKTYSDDELKGKNLEGQDLSGCEFYKCDLSDTRFAGCNLIKAKFTRCRSISSHVDITGANLFGATFEGCTLPKVIFQNAILTESQITKCQFPEANLTNCNFDNSHISGLSIPHAQLYLASFRNVRIDDIVYEPTQGIGFSRVVKTLWRATVPKQGTIFTSGTELSPFISFCSRQYRLEQLLTEISNKSFYVRIPHILILLAFGIISDFGNSLRRWFITCVSIVLVFAICYSLGVGMKAGIDRWNALSLSIQHFINSSPDGAEITWLVIMEKVTGYFMLGILVSILTNKFFQRW